MIDLLAEPTSAPALPRRALPAPSTLWASRLGLWLGLLLAFVALAGCTIPAVIPSAVPAPQPDAFNGAIADLDDYAIPTPAPTVEPELTVIVDTAGSRANLRGGPGANFPIIGKANPDEAFEVIARSEDNTWWQVCCLRTGADGNPLPADTPEEEATGWIADSVVRLAGDEEAIAISQPVFDPELTAEWNVDWQCGSDRCEVKECNATVAAAVSRDATQQLLPVEHQVTWDDACFDTDSWVFEVNQFSGREQTGEYKDNFLYSYWLGQQPGEANGVYTLADGRAAAVYCSGPHQVEIEEGSGWTTVYEGNTCHDVRTGMLVYLSYNKRWLFTGEYEDETYERAYFGDFESLEQKLVETNAELQYVEKKR
jgi:hypothetical protein